MQSINGFYKIQGCAMLKPFKQQGDFMRNMGFKRILMISIYALMFGALFVSETLSYMNARQVTIENIQDKGMTYIEHNAGMIEKWFKGKKEAIQSAERYMEEHEFTSDVQAVNLAKLIKDSGGFNDFVLYSYEDPKAYAAESGGGWIDGIAYDIENLVKSRPWYIQARNKIGMSTTEIYENISTNAKIFSLILSDNEKMVLGDISLDMIDELTNKLNFKGATVFITDKSGRIISSNRDTIDKDYLLSNSERKSAFDAMKNNTSNVTEYELAGVDKIGFSEEIKLTSDESWFLFIVLTKEAAYSELNDVIKEAAITSIILLVSMFIITQIIFRVAYRPIITLKDMISNLASGDCDLTKRLDIKTDDDLGDMARGINTFIENLQSLLIDVEQASKHIEESVFTLKGTSDNNSVVLVKHSEETEVIAKAIEEMSVTINEIAMNTTNASSVSDTASKRALESKEAIKEASNVIDSLVDDVNHTSSSITDIDKNIHDISGVLDVINGVAEQTNLLALNAAIEAARAGEAGRGFAVVADGVRSLAAETQNSTRDIEHKISFLTDGTKDAVHLMEQTSGTCSEVTKKADRVTVALDDVVKEILHMNDMNAQIATATEQQGITTNEISNNMNHIKEMVGALSDNGDAVVGEVDSLVAANVQLKSVISSFTLR